MTASIATGVVHAAHVARRTQPAAHPRPQEWEALYERQLARQGTHGSSEGARDASASTLAPQSEAQEDSQRAPDESSVVAVAVGGHLELQVAGRTGSATMSGVGTDPSDPTGPDTTSNVPREIGVAIAGVPSPTARTATTSFHGSRQSSAPAAHPSAPAFASESALARAVSGSGVLALPAAASAQAAGPPDSQPSSRRSAPTATLVDAQVAGTLLQGSVAVPGSGAGATHDGEGEDPQDSSPDDLATDGTSGRHYGTFPLIVSGELLELEFVALHAGAAQPASAAVRRIFLSMRPPGMGRVELTAQNLGDRVTVRLAGQAAEGGTAVVDVAALLQRLGWGAYPVKFAME